MTKRARIVVLVASVLIALLISLGVGVIAQQDDKVEPPSKILPFTQIRKGPGTIESAEPTGWWRVPIGDTIPPYTVLIHGPYWSAALYVCIDTQSPNVGLAVSIIVGGTVKWTGTLYAGQCSPTVSANWAETYVTVANGHAVSVTFTGSIWLYSP